jgi:hypothetical protein
VLRTALAILVTGSERIDNPQSGKVSIKCRQWAILKRGFATRINLKKDILICCIAKVNAEKYLAKVILLQLFVSDR